MRLNTLNSTDWAAFVSGYGETILALAKYALICGENMGRKTDRISVLSGSLRLSDKRITRDIPTTRGLYGDSVALPGPVAYAGEDAT